MATTKCAERPKSVDPGKKSYKVAVCKVPTDYVCCFIVALFRKWQSRDLDFARNKFSKLEEAARNKQQERERRQKELALSCERGDTKRDVKRLFAATVASAANTISTDELDALEHRRVTGGAHSSAMALTGRDLQKHSRAVPQWIKQG